MQKLQSKKEVYPKYLSLSDFSKKRKEILFHVMAEHLPTILVNYGNSTVVKVSKLWVFKVFVLSMKKVFYGGRYK